MRKLTEAGVSPPDVKAIFKGATDLRNNPSGLGKMFKSLRKDKIELSDLQQAWKNDGFSDDTRDIKRILDKQFGFSDSEINKVFAEVFGKSDTEAGYEEPVASPVINKIAEYAKNNGLTDSLIAFMEQEFGKELGLGKKATTEDIRHIFTRILGEDRPNRHLLIKEQEKTQFGRKRK
jgi:hypothetical protein